MFHKSPAHNPTSAPLTSFKETFLRRRRKDKAKVPTKPWSIFDTLGNETITLNVGGVLFKTYYKTLGRLPGTRLFSLAYQHALNPKIEPTEFYDHDPDVFSSVLDYYRHGQLHNYFHLHTFKGKKV